MPISTPWAFSQALASAVKQLSLSGSPSVQAVLLFHISRLAQVMGVSLVRRERRWVAGRACATAMTPVVCVCAAVGVGSRPIVATSGRGGRGDRLHRRCGMRAFPPSAGTRGIHLAGPHAQCRTWARRARIAGSVLAVTRVTTPRFVSQDLTERVLGPALLAVAQAHMYQARPATTALLRHMDGAAAAALRRDAPRVVVSEAQHVVRAVTTAHPEVAARVLGAFRQVMPESLLSAEDPDTHA